MIRDQIIVDLRDTSLSEKLQLNPELTLEKAITAVWQPEAVKKQQNALQSQSASTLRSCLCLHFVIST